MFLALRNLLQDKLRLTLSVIGVALAVMLILFLFGLRTGIFKGATAYLDNAPGSVVVLPQGVENTFTGTGQFMPSATADAVSRIDGAAQITPVLQMMVIPELHGKKEGIRLTGYDAALGGGPWNLAEGRAPVADYEIVLDRVLAKRHDFKVGDTFELGGRPLTVVGLSNGTSSWLGTYAFARKSFVESLLLAPGAASFVLITPAPGTKPAELVARSQDLSGTNLLLKSRVMANDRQILAGTIDQVIFLMVAAAFIVGALVVGMVIYTATIERQGEYGVLKAIGARSGILYRIVVFQAVIAVGLGVLAGIGFAFAMGGLVTTLRPQFFVSIQPSAIGVTLAAGFVMAILGALVPARAVARLAPAEVFRR